MWSKPYDLSTVGEIECRWLVMLIDRVLLVLSELRGVAHTDLNLDGTLLLRFSVAWRPVVYPDLVYPELWGGRDSGCQRVRCAKIVLLT